MQFFKDAFREFRHVVWPTNKETRDFFVIVIIFLIFFTAYVFVANQAFSHALFWVKDTINPSAEQINFGTPTVTADGISINGENTEGLTITPSEEVDQNVVNLLNEGNSETVEITE